MYLNLKLQNYAMVGSIKLYSYFIKWNDISASVFFNYQYDQIQQDIIN